MNMKFCSGTFSLLLVLIINACSNSSGTENTSNQGASTSGKESSTLKSGVITVRGDVHHPLELTLDSLLAMTVHTVQDYKIVNHTGEVKRIIPTCRGVLLRDIVEKAHINQKDAKDQNFYVVVRASDGYMATYSWAELFNHITGDSTFVIIEEDGHPILDRGPFIAITKGDKISGVRHVYLVNEIDVHRVQ